MSSFFTAFSSASKQAANKSEATGPAVPQPPQPNISQQAAPAPLQQHSKPMPVGHTSLAHPEHQHHEGATDLDLYRTFSPSDVGMWSWEATTGEGNGKGPSIWSKLFSTNSNKS